MPGGLGEENSYLDKFEQLPIVVQDYLLDEKAADAIGKIAADFKLSDEQKNNLVDIIGDASVKITPLVDLKNKLETVLSLPPDTSKRLFFDVLGNYFLPLNEFFDEEISGLIEAGGGKAKGYPQFRVVIKKEATGDAGKEVAGKFFDLFEEENLRSRLEDTIESRFRGVRTDTDFRDILTRSAKVGGLGLDGETAEEIIEATAEKMRSVKIVDESEITPSAESKVEISVPVSRPAAPSILVVTKKEEPKPAIPMVETKKEPEIKINLPRPEPKPLPPRPLVKIINPPPAQKAALGKIPSVETKKEDLKSSPPKPVEKVSLLNELKKNIVPPPVKVEVVKPAPAPMPEPALKKSVSPPLPPSPKPAVALKPEKKSEEKILLNLPAGRQVPPFQKGEKSDPLPSVKGELERDLKNLRESANIPAAAEALAGRRVIQGEKKAPNSESKKTSKEISDAELEREIQHIKHDQMTKIPLAPINFLEIATGIVNQSQIILNQEQVGRLKTILTARLKDIRDGQETKDILSRDYALGGMGFSEAQVGAVVPILEKEFIKVSDRLRVGVEEKIAADKRIEEERRRKTLETARFVEDNAREKRFAELIGEKPRKIIPAVRQNGPPGTPVIPSPSQVGKPKIQDVKYEPKLVGPVDEIGSLTLTDFRRLGATAKEAALKIKEKIESLKADSIKKWQEGISAWNGGEVNKLYMQLFGEALQKRKSLKDVAAEREAAKEPFLSQDEINAIMELNKSLRF